MDKRVCDLFPRTDECKDSRNGGICPAIMDENSRSKNDPAGECQRLVTNMTGDEGASSTGNLSCW